MVRVRRSLCLALLAGLLATLLLPARPNAAATSFAWKATNGQGSIYLVGSVHMLTAAYYPLSPALDGAFRDANLLVEELDFDEALAPEAQLLMLTRGLLPPSQSLDQVVSRETFALVSARLTSLGLPIEPLKRFKPWALALTLLSLEWQSAGFDPNLGLDRHFFDRAKAAGTPIMALETLEFQISRFDDLSMAEQDRLLASSVSELETQKAAVEELAGAWKAGDAAAIERIVLQDVKEEPQIYERILVERNRLWMPKIEALFARPGRAIVVVGAAHLVGPDGLLAMLEARGYTVEQI